MSASLTSDLSYNTNNTICCQHIILNFFDYFHFFGPLASAFPLFFPFPDDTYTDISVLYHSFFIFFPLIEMDHGSKIRLQPTKAVRRQK